MFPRPKTADPSVTTATVLRLIVRRRASDGSATIAWHIRATPGVYARDKSSRVFNGTFEAISIFPPRCKRNVLSLTLRTVKSELSEIAVVICSACSASMVSHVMSMTTFSRRDSTTSSAVIVAPAPVITVVASATGFEAGGPSTRIVIPYPGEVDAIYTTPYKRSPASPKPGTM